jgi:hypothetical protein
VGTISSGPHLCSMRLHEARAKRFDVLDLQGQAKSGEPSGPELQRRYRLYKRLKAALALPAGPQRLEALHKAYRELRAN